MYILLANCILNLYGILHVLCNDDIWDLDIIIYIYIYTCYVWCSSIDVIVYIYTNAIIINIFFLIILAGKYHYIKVLITRGTLKQHIKKEEIKINNTQNNEK